MRISEISVPNVDGLSPEDALRKLQRHCRDMAEAFVQVNNEVEDLKRKFAELDQRLRFN